MRSGRKRPLLQNEMPATLQELVKDGGVYAYSRTDFYTQARERLEESDPRLLNWIGSNDASGYIREKCLRYLISNFLPGDEYPILHRFADWVPQIRDLARSWILKDLRRFSPVQMGDYSLLFRYLNSREGLRSDPCLRHINDVLLSSARQLDEAEWRTVEFYFNRDLPGFSLWRTREHRPSPTRHWWNFDHKSLLNIHPGKLTHEEAGLFWKTKTVGIRCKFIRCLVDAGMTPPKNRLLESVVHKNRRLRDLCRFHLERDYAVDVYGIFQRLVGERFYYIADFMRPEDVPLFLEGVKNSSTARTRINCLRALVTVAPEQLHDVDIGAVALKDMQSRRFLIRYLSDRFYPVEGNPPRPAKRQPMVFSKDEADTLLLEIAEMPSRKKTQLTIWEILNRSNQVEP